MVRAVNTVISQQYLYQVIGWNGVAEVHGPQGSQTGLETLKKRWGRFFAGGGPLMSDL
jgi:hypothetical protein